MRVLIEKETVYSEEFEMIMNGASADEVMRVIDDRTYRNFGNKKPKDTVIHLPSASARGSEVKEAEPAPEPRPKPKTAIKATKKNKEERIYLK